ncbi:MAG: 4Fe-4S binding protein [Anaerovoracaceae bacterium]
MKIEKVWKIYFSPTGTTKKVVTLLGEEIAAALGVPADEYNFTLPSARQNFPQVESGDLVIFGMPTYAGRLPNLMLKYLDTISGNGAMAVPVVTFGNRAFDNSLIELRNILENHDFHTVAAGAFSCEHSFSTELGAYRPDWEDECEIKDFAAHISQKLSDADPDQLKECAIEVPGDPDAGYYQPRDRKGNFIDIRKVKPVTGSKCVNCGVCARVCPMGAIDPSDVTTVPGICIKCNACVKRCTRGAKFFDDKGYLYHKEELEAMYGGWRAENSVFI